MDYSEIWKDLIELDNYYQVSNFGRIKRKQRVVKSSINPSGRKIKEKIMNQQDNGKGYKQIYVCINTKRKVFYIHRLVAKYFLKETKDKKQVNHKDMDKSNNHYMNLEWCTAQENSTHAANGIASRSVFGYKGVKRADSKVEKYVSRLTYQGKEIYLGVYETVIEAVKVRDRYIMNNKLPLKTQIINTRTT